MHPTKEETEEHKSHIASLKVTYKLINEDSIKDLEACLTVLKLFSDLKSHKRAIDKIEDAIAWLKSETFNRKIY